jgi:hypothetical protein
MITWIGSIWVVFVVTSRNSQKQQFIVHESNHSSASCILLLQRWLQEVEEVEDDVLCSASGGGRAVAVELPAWPNIMRHACIVVFAVFQRIYPQASNVREWSLTQHFPLAKETVDRNCRFAIHYTGARSELHFFACCASACFAAS